MKQTNPRIMYMVVIVMASFLVIPFIDAYGCSCIPNADRTMCVESTGCGGADHGSAVCTMSGTPPDIACGCHCSGAPPPPPPRGYYPVYNDISQPDSTYYYHWFAQPVSMKTVTKIAAGKNTETITFYDGLGREMQTQTLLPDGNAQIVNVDYDKVGNKVKTSIPYEQAAFGTYHIPTWDNHDGIHYYTEFIYDSLGRTKKIINPDGTQKTFSYGARTDTARDELNREVVTTKDAYGRPKTVRDPLNYQTTYNYFDPLGLRSEVVNPGSQTTKAFKDSIGAERRSQNPDYSPNPSLIVRRNIKYDTNGNLIIAGDACSASISETDISHDPSYYQCLRYTGLAYDSLDRLTCTRYDISAAQADSWDGTTCPSDAQVWNYYDSYAGTDCENPGDSCTDEYSCPKGRLTEVKATDSNYIDCLYYDVRGLVRKEVRYIDGSMVGTSALYYSYDNAGNMVSMTYPNGKVVSYGYNNLNQMTSVSVDGNLLSSYSYNPDGTISSKAYDNKCR